MSEQIEGQTREFFKTSFLIVGTQGDISCQFMPLGGTIGSRYVLQLLLNEKSQSC
jgi:hypothetical protein